MAIRNCIAYLCRAFLSIIFYALVSIEFPDDFVTKYLWYIRTLLCRHVRVVRAFSLVILTASERGLVGNQIRSLIKDITCLHDYYSTYMYVLHDN